jgi:hypothetical protein
MNYFSSIQHNSGRSRRKEALISTPYARLQGCFLVTYIPARKYRNNKHLQISPPVRWWFYYPNAHIFVCFQAYCLWVTLQQRLRPLAPGLTSRQALDQMAGVQMLDVEIPTTDGRMLKLTRTPSPTRQCNSCSSALAKTCPNSRRPN